MEIICSNALLEVFRHFFEILMSSVYLLFFFLEKLEEKKSNNSKSDLVQKIVQYFGIKINVKKYFFIPDFPRITKLPYRLL